MEVLRIEDHKRNKKLVYLEEDAPAFCLYAKEVSRFDLKEGEELGEDTYSEIMELLSKRAKERALYLLEDMARTGQQIRTKLKEGFYPDEAVEYALSYCIKKHYIDDDDYARRFIASRSDRLSRRMIEKKLYEKGIDRDIIAAAFEEMPDFEEETVRKLIGKKYGDVSGASFEEKQKIVRRLLSAGFAYDAVKQALDGTS